jgi:predicted nuclease of restriction endonuclease-like (RecB) superfamily
MAVKETFARAFYETEAIRGAWSVRQLDRQINTQFYERAIKWQKRALDLGLSDKEQMEKARLRLGLYEGGKPYTDE